MDPVTFRRVPIAAPDGERQAFVSLDASGLDATGDGLAAGHRALLAAYVTADYEVGDPARFVLHVDAASADLRNLLRACRVDSALYITAWNPLSEPTDAAANEAAHERLQSAVRARGFVSVEGLGRDPSGRWPGERSLLVPGPSLAESCRLARQFRQAGILWSDDTGVPRLYILDLPRLTTSPGA